MQENEKTISDFLGFISSPIIAYRIYKFSTNAGFGGQELTRLANIRIKSGLDTEEIFGFDTGESFGFVGYKDYINKFLEALKKSKKFRNQFRKRISFIKDYYEDFVVFPYYYDDAPYMETYGVMHPRIEYRYTIDWDSYLKTGNKEYDDNYREILSYVEVVKPPWGHTIDWTPIFDIAKEIRYCYREIIKILTDETIIYDSNPEPTFSLYMDNYYDHTKFIAECLRESRYINDVRSVQINQLIQGRLDYPQHWHGSKAELKYFINKLVESGLVINPGKKKWDIIVSSFVDSQGNKYTKRGISDSKIPPERSKKAIDRMFQWASSDKKINS